MIRVKQNLTHVLMVSYRSLKTNRWLTYQVHSIHRSRIEAQRCGDDILLNSPSNSVRYKVELYDI